MPHQQTVTTIYCDGQFWVALIERLDGETVVAARHVFGPEPSNAELLDWAGQGFSGLRFVPAPARVLTEPPSNPKRRKRVAAAEAKAAATSSRARDALTAASALNAMQRKTIRAMNGRAVAARRHADRVARKKARRHGKG